MFIMDTHHFRKVKMLGKIVEEILWQDHWGKEHVIHKPIKPYINSGVSPVSVKPNEVKRLKLIKLGFRAVYEDVAPVA